MAEKYYTVVIVGPYPDRESTHQAVHNTLDQMKETILLAGVDPSQVEYYGDILDSKELLKFRNRER